MRLLFGYLVFAALLLLGPSCFAQAVTIRIVNADNGRPLPDEQVDVFLLYQGGEAVPEKYDTHLSFHTGANGEVRYVLPTPAPGHLSAQVELKPGHWDCECGSAWASTEELIRNGIVSQMPPGGRGKSAVPANAIPGEILFLARPLPFWLRLLYPVLYPLVKG